MPNESARKFRGWSYAVFSAICILLILFLSENFSKIKQPGFYRAPRTAWMSVSTKPTHFPKIATEPIPLAIEPLSDSIDSSTWVDYRSNHNLTLNLLEPPAGARLAAPVPVDPQQDPFLDAINFQRNPSALAELAAQTNAIAVSQVSQVRPPRESFDENSEHLERVTNHLSNANWPKSQRLSAEIASIRIIAGEVSSDNVLEWLSRIEVSVEQLTQQPINDPASAETLDALNQLAQEGEKLAAELREENSKIAGEISRLSYSIQRRHAVWKSVSKCVIQNQTKLVSIRHHEFDQQSLRQQLSAVAKAIQNTGDAGNWSKYLMLESLNRMSDNVITGSEDQVTLVREFLSRVTDPRVSEPQRNFLASPEIHKLADQLHPLSIGPVDYRKLVEDIETLESDPVHRCSRTLADAMQSLRFSEHEEQAAIAHAIGTHFRNANMRIAVSEEFINRMMPKSTMTNKPVRQNILGAETRGASQIETRLVAEFNPDPNAWNISLKLDGDISSQTKSSRQGATFYNSSLASVTAVRDIKISIHGIQINGSQATVASSDSLKRFSTEWDALPILGDMVRHFAHQEFMEARPLAKRIMQRTIAKQTDEEFDSQLKQKVDAAQNQFEKRLIGPLQSLDLHPLVVDMQTTENRLIVRYRVASTDQLAANTPRPMAPGDSQLSLQIHQSAFNNMAGQVVTGDKEWTMQELSDKIADLLQQPRKPLEADAPTDVTVRFIEGRPVTVEFEDGRLWLTLRIASLEQPGRIHLKNFIIRTAYVPSVDGLHAELSRDGAISVDGPKLTMRDRIPLRAIFARVFANRSAIPMVSEELLKDPRAAGLAVSQLELRDGWLAIAVSPEKSPHVALLKSAQTTSR